MSLALAGLVKPNESRGYKERRMIAHRKVKAGINAIEKPEGLTGEQHAQ